MHTSQATSSFPELLARLRQGDPCAAAEMVGTYEREIRRIIRLKMTDPRIRRTLDSMDICQSVLANFFLRVALGQFDLHSPEQLLSLLLTMARNKVIDKVRMEQARGHDRRVADGTDGEMLAAIPGHEDSPSEIVAREELLQAAQKLFTEEERYLVSERSAGREWAEIGAALGRSPEAVRKQMERALDRVTQKLGVA